jgi:hypothetical protein
MSNIMPEETVQQKQGCIAKQRSFEAGASPACYVAVVVVIFLQLLCMCLSSRGVRLKLKHW